MIPTPVVYAGLAGLVLALLVAAAQNRWQVKVILLLTLRLAIGWHFLFEGLHKVHSHLAGPSEATRPFTSEPYFRSSPTSVGKFLHGLYRDPRATARLQVSKELTPEAFQRLPMSEQAALCPFAVREELSQAEYGSELGGDRLDAAAAKYAAWLYGLDARPVRLKPVTGEVMLTVPQRRAYIQSLKEQVEQEHQNRLVNLGRGTIASVNRAARLEQEIQDQETALAEDARLFVADLIQELGGRVTDNLNQNSAGQTLDTLTMWFLTVVGSCLMLGLFTRVNCLLAAGFLATTYAIHPALPWLPLPPNTEGNPVFINKNIIEMLALLVLACYPTGRWLGLDALLARCRSRKHHAAAAN